MPKYRLTLHEITPPQELTATEARSLLKPVEEIVYEQQFDDIDVNALIRDLNKPRRKRAKTSAS